LSVIQNEQGWPNLYNVFPGFNGAQNIFNWQARLASSHSSTPARTKPSPQTAVFAASA
jgi:hypothetical protein